MWSNIQELNKFCVLGYIRHICNEITWRLTCKSV